jgi:hypothetical protein
MTETLPAEIRHAAVIEEFNEIRKNTLRGFAKVRLASGMILIDVSIHVSNGKAWAALPAKPMLDKEGRALRDPEGKIRYAPVVAFATREHRDRFSVLVVEAVRDTHPEALS